MYQSLRGLEASVASACWRYSTNVF